MRIGTPIILATSAERGDTTMEGTTTSDSQRLLIPLDGSLFAEQALPCAQAIGGTAAELILLEAIPPAEAVRGPLGNVLIPAADIRRAYAEGIAIRLLRARQTWLGNRPNVRCETAVGDAAEEILRVADRDHVDLIVMASHGRGALQRWVIGSVADRVVRTSPIPVMVMRPRDEIPVEAGVREIRRLLVPYDGSDLAAQALPFAKVLALRLQVPVLLVKVSAIAHDLQSAMFSGVAVSPDVYDEILESSGAEDQAQLAHAARGFQDAGVSVRRPRRRWTGGGDDCAAGGANGCHGDDQSWPERTAPVRPRQCRREAGSPRTGAGHPRPGTSPKRIL